MTNYEDRYSLARLLAELTDEAEKIEDRHSTGLSMVICCHFFITREVSEASAVSLWCGMRMVVSNARACPSVIPVELEEQFEFRERNEK